MTLGLDDAPILQSGIRNHFLASLSDESFRDLTRGASIVDLVAKQILQPGGGVPDLIYFPEGGIISFTINLPRSGESEFGILGRDGLSCFSGILPSQTSPVTSVVQIGGCKAVCVRADAFRAAAERHADIQHAIYDAMYSFMAQMAMTALSNVRHHLNARLARWLLMCADRVDGDEIPLTHEFMAMMLGAQRTSVTSALHVLEGEGGIWARRGVVVIRDRERLEASAGEAYSLARR